MKQNFRGIFIKMEINGIEGKNQRKIQHHTEGQKKFNLELGGQKSLRIQHCPDLRGRTYIYRERQDDVICANGVS